MRVLILICSLLLTFSLPAGAAEKIIWNKAPITILLPVGKERMVSFPQPVELGMSKKALPASRLSVLNVNGTLYLKALTQFGKTRVQVRLSDGQVVLLDLKGVDSSQNDVPLEVALSSEKMNKREVKATDAANPIVLTRFALQQLYGVERLIETPRGISRVPLKSTKTVTLFKYENVMAMPRAQWMLGGLYVTAVELRNLKENLQKLELKEIYGDWVSAALYPSSTLNSRGRLPDTTMLVLVSNQPFAKALRSHRYVG